MPNYKISIQYDGSDFFGWQSQPNGNTIQDELTKAIFQISSENVNLIGSGRTDSGVHALGQVANFTISNSIDGYKFKHSLNSILPPAISIKNIKQVNDDFHSRFDAKKRSYIYFIRSDKNPFFDKYSYHYPHTKSIDISNLKSLSQLLVGEHNFTSFCKTKTDTENKVCNINDLNWRITQDLLIMRVEADRFLHGMVRTIVGTLLFASLHNKSKDYLIEILEMTDREAAGESVPAKGLFLNKVKY
jgi:tRNA pseudouridine38-40 synthase